VTLSLESELPSSFRLGPSKTSYVDRRRHANSPSPALRVLDNAVSGPYATNSRYAVKNYWRVEDAWMGIDRLSGVERELDRSFADEVAIDFPAIGNKVNRMRHAFDSETEPSIAHLNADITLSRHQAFSGAAVPLEVPLRCTCRACGGRGEVWGDPCAECEGTGHALRRRLLTVSVPPGVVDGTRFSFSVSSPRGPRTRVDVRVAVT
jgi:hypothetical protein